MITIKNKSSIAKMEQAGFLLQQVYGDINHLIKAGTTTLEIDSAISVALHKRNLVSKTKGYKGYRHVSCISLNDEVVHGVPCATTTLKNGDLVKIDICASWNGFCADMARAFSVGQPSDLAVRLVNTAQKALDKGIAAAIPGNRLGDISAAIQKEVEKDGFAVVRDFAGHGIGKLMHEDPEILNYGKPGTGPLLQPGMAFALEPMITAGSYKIFITEDGWTVKTVDRSLAAHVEDTIVITQREPKVITRSNERG